MSPDISERSFEEAMERGLLRHGLDACAGDAAAVRETPPGYGETPAVERPAESNDCRYREAASAPGELTRPHCCGR